jgi:hypothetical protein
MVDVGFMNMKRIPDVDRNVYIDCPNFGEGIFTRAYVPLMGVMRMLFVGLNALYLAVRMFATGRFRPIPDLHDTLVQPPWMHQLSRTQGR